MRKLYCDRCGKEVDQLFEVSVPKELASDTTYRSENVEVCKSCNSFITEAKREYDRAMANVRIAFYKTLFPND